LAVLAIYRFMTAMHRARLGICVISLAILGCSSRSDAPVAAWQRTRGPATTHTVESLKQQRRQFQDQQLITAKPFSWICNAGNAGDAPRLVWRDAEEMRRLDCTSPLRVRWFDADLKDAAVPDHPGRWGAFVEGVAPNGTPLRRSFTFFCRPKGFFIYAPPELRISLPPQTSPVDATVWREHQQELDRAGSSLIVQNFNDSEQGAILLAGLSESKPLGRPAGSLESASVLNDDFQLAMKLKALRLDGKVRPLAPPRHREGAPAPVLHEGSLAEAGMRAVAKDGIDKLCREWADDSGEPFVTLIARHGAIVTHAAFGHDAQGKPIDLDYRCGVFSITKSVTALLFARFVDERLIGLDDSIATVFPDYPRNDPAHVPTFRQCLSHMSGLSGHGDFGAVRNPQLENVLLNAIDVNEAGKTYTYSGMGFDLTAKAMELMTGRSWRRLYQEGLFDPLGIGDVPMSDASAGAEFTARELAALAQLIANRGSYGDRELFSRETFAKLLPEKLSQRYPGVTDPESEGIGMHWMRPLRAGAQPSSTRPEDLLFGPNVVAHGSLSASMFYIDLDHDLIIVQVRRNAGARFNEWAPKFFRTIAQNLESRD
jgi:CubicO group peptidase (beta-lactamase class C family)